MLTAGAMELMRDRIEDTFDKTCVIVRTSAGTAYSDGMGGYGTASGTAIAGTHACRVAPAGRGAVEAVIAGQVQAVGTHVISLPALTDVRPSDRIRIGTRTFNVVGGSGERSYELSKSVAANEINEDEGA